MDKYITSQHYSELLSHKARADNLAQELMEAKAEIALLKQQIKFKRLN